MSHTNIDAAAIHQEFLTGASVSGELLSDKLQKGSLTPEEALQYALDIGGALSRAHPRGEVHGAVSPACVAIAGTRAVLLKPGAALSAAAAPFRAPELVAGATADWRSDIFSFGALLVALSGAVTSGLSQTVNGAEPESPIRAAMERVSAGCLEKDPALRRQRIQNAVIELKLLGRSLPRIAAGRDRTSSGVSASPSRKPMRRLAASAVKTSFALAAYPAPRGFRARLWVVMALALLACAASVAAVVWIPNRNSSPVYRFSVQPEDSKYPGMPAISPDGRYLTWAATGPTGKRMLWIRALDESHAKLVPNTEGAEAPFWSPDSRFIAFFAGQFLKKMRLADGNPAALPENICPAESLAGGGAWNKDGTILFAAGLSGGLSRVPASGGMPHPVTALSQSNSERSHLWPQFLPDGKHFIFYVLTDMGETSGVYAGALDSPRYIRLFVAETNAVYAADAGTLTAKGGYLLYISDGNLTAQPFDPSKLRTTGKVVTLATGVGAVQSFSLAQISVSNNGTLIYQSGGRPTRQLVWMDRTGKAIRTLGEPADWGPPRISPDGKSVAVGKPDFANPNPVIWILDAEGQSTRLSDTAQAASISPVWSPDGSRIAYANNREGQFDLYVQPLAGPAKPELVYRSHSPKNPDDWSHDGKWLLFRDFEPGMSSGVFGLNLADRKTRPLADTIHTEGYSALSPDGKWLAYQSDEEGLTQVFVQNFDNGTPGAKKVIAVSVHGGGLPRWRHDGGELYYATQPGQIYAVTFHAHGDDFTVDPAHELFHTRPLPNTWNLYDVSPDGQRFLMNVPLEWPNSSEIKVTTSWTKALQE